MDWALLPLLGPMLTLAHQDRALLHLNLPLAHRVVVVVASGSRGEFLRDHLREQ